jgi:hypothetical protein
MTGISVFDDLYDPENFENVEIFQPSQIRSVSVVDVETEDEYHGALPGIYFYVPQPKGLDYHMMVMRGVLPRLLFKIANSLTPKILPLETTKEKEVHIDTGDMSPPSLERCDCGPFRVSAKK